MLIIHIYIIHSRERVIERVSVREWESGRENECVREREREKAREK